MAIITDPQDLASLKRSGQLLAATLRSVAKRVKPGVSTLELDTEAERLIRAGGGEPSFLGYQGYPASLCVSVNDEVVHGIPSDRVLKDGDLMTLDLGVIIDGWYTDAAITVPVGTISPTAKKLMDATKRSLDIAIKAAVVGARVGDIGAAVQRVIDPTGFGIVRELCGHGVGRAVHEEPQIPNYGRAGSGPLLQAGMVIAIEPMITAGAPGVHTLDDGWTVVTNDSSLAAHYEHTLVVTERGPLIVTA